MIRTNPRSASAERCLVEDLPSWLGAGMRELLPGMVIASVGRHGDVTGLDDRSRSILATEGDDWLLVSREMSLVRDGSSAVVSLQSRSTSYRGVLVWVGADLVVVAVPTGVLDPSAPPSDRLTGLPGRERIVDQPERLGSAAAALFVDLDGFKAVNDQHGHGVGDAVLAVIARRFERQVRRVDPLVRWGGDEFVAIVGTSDLRVVTAVAGRLIAAAARPVEVASTTHRLTCSIGIAVTPSLHDQCALVADADRAMYQAKRSGGNCWVLACSDTSSISLPPGAGRAPAGLPVTAQARPAPRDRRP